MGSRLVQVRQCSRFSEYRLVLRNVPEGHPGRAPLSSAARSPTTFCPHLLQTLGWHWTLRGELMTLVSGPYSSERDNQLALSSQIQVSGQRGDDSCPCPSSDSFGSSLSFHGGVELQLPGFLMQDPFPRLCQTGEAGSWAVPRALHPQWLHAAQTTFPGVAAVNGLRLSQDTCLPGLGSPPAPSRDSTISPAGGEGAGEFSESRGRVFSVPASNLFLLTVMEPTGYTGRWGSTSSSHNINTLKHGGCKEEGSITPHGEACRSQYKLLPSVAGDHVAREPWRMGPSRGTVHGPSGQSSGASC